MHEGGPTEYRALSKAAVVALVFAMLGLLSFFVDLMTIASVIAILLALVAYRAIKAADGDLTGSGIATLALTISMLCVGNVSAHYLTFRRYLESEGRVHAATWIGLIRDGKRMEAHQLTRPESDRVRAGMSLAEHYADMGAMGESMEEYPFRDLTKTFETPHLRAFVERIEAGDVPRCVRSLGASVYGDEAYVGFEYQFKDGKLFAMDLRRVRRGDVADWQFWGVVGKQ
ncbi:MAG: hypothetical protein KDB14_13110 [Planctomycetales bacterium]|nr:hypothetical protein [Planctomycetales bacterium]